MAFNKDIPTSSTSLKASNPQILANQSQVQEALAKNHQFEGTDAATQTGKHEVLEMIEKASAGASSAGEGHFQTIDSGTQAELAFTSEDGTEVQLTSDGKSGSATTDLLANDAVVAGTLGVTGASTVGGTLDVTGNIDPTTYETTNGGFLDEDDLASDLATSTASQQSIKAYADAYIKLVDSKVATTDAGTFTSGAWQKRTIAEESDVGGNVSVASSVITLAAGTYQCRISCPAYQVGRHKARLRNTTGSATLMVGTSEIAGAGSTITTKSIIEGIFTIAASKSIEVQHKCQTTNPTNGLGIASSFDEVEIYTIAEFWKR